MKLKHIFPILLGFILFILSSFFYEILEFISICLKLKVWEFELSEFIRLSIIIYGIPKIISLLKRRRKEIMELLKIIKRNKITILGYLATIIVDVIILGITAITLRNKEFAEAIFGVYGLVNNGVINEPAIYTAVISFLTAITGINFVASSKRGWENEEDYQKRIDEIELRKTINWFLKEINSRINDYLSSDRSTSYSSMFPNGIKMNIKDKEVIINSRNEIVKEFLSNQDYLNIVNKEIFRIVSEEVNTMPKEDIKW